MGRGLLLSFQTVHASLELIQIALELLQSPFEGIEGCGLPEILSESRVDVSETFFQLFDALFRRAHFGDPGLERGDLFLEGGDGVIGG